MNTQKNFLSNPVVVLFGALICCALWGSAFPCIKIGYNMMQLHLPIRQARFYMRAAALRLPESSQLFLAV